MERREFLRLLALGSLAAATGAGTWGCAGATRFPQKDNSSGKFLVFFRDGESSAMARLVSWSDFSYEEFAVPCLPHSVIQDRSNPRILYLFEIFGSCLRLDLDSGASVRVDHRQSEFLFNGHGVLSSGGELLICSERQGTKNGLSIRESGSLKKLYDAPEACNSVHYVTHLPQQKSLVACGNMSHLSGGEGGAITFFDYQTRSILRRVDFDFPVLHLFPISSQAVAGIGRLRRRQKPRKDVSNKNSSWQNVASYLEPEEILPAPICIASLDGTSQTLWDESQKSLYLDGFSVVHVPRENAFLASFAVGNLLRWQDGKITHRKAIPRPETIVLSPDHKHFLVASDISLKLMRTDTLEEEPLGIALPPVFLLASYRS